MNQTEKIYFPNLNGVRFIAAFIVLRSHLEQFLCTLGLDRYSVLSIVGLSGDLGVKLFFVLSGFLITYLLLSEEKLTNKISIKKFYFRRILRIWPLYYFIVLLSFFVFTKINILQMPEFLVGLNKDFWFYFVLFLLFLPNVAFNGLYVVVPYASQSWSVGIEEQFYLFWPWLMKLFKNKLLMMFLVIVSYLTIKYWGFRFVKHFVFWSKEMDVFRAVWNQFTINCMAIGGIFAYLAFHKSNILKLLLNKIFFFSILCVTFLLISQNVVINSNIYSEVYAFLFGVIILNLAINNYLKNILEFKVLNYLGQISYGIYMYHPIAIVLMIRLFQKFNWLQYHFLLLFSSFVFTILLAGISYRYIEKRFIQMKTRYSNVISGDNAR